jgi:hypothetical protein
MIIETMPIKTIVPEEHTFVFDGYTYTLPYEIYNPNTYVRPISIKPSNYILPILDKTNVSYTNITNINALCSEGLPQYITYIVKERDFDSLDAYDYVTAIPLEVTRIDNKIDSAKDEYHPDFLTLVQSC